MAASLVTRSHWNDDDGSGSTGTIPNESELQKIYDQIDLLLSGTGSYATLEFGGGVKVDGVLDITGYKETLTPLGDVAAAGAVTINLALGSVWTVRFTGAPAAPTFSNIPASGRFCSFLLRIGGDGTPRAWSWFDSTVWWDGGVAPTRTSTNARFDWYMFSTIDGGANWGGFIIGQNRVV